MAGVVPTEFATQGCRRRESRRFRKAEEGHRCSPPVLPTLVAGETCREHKKQRWCQTDEHRKGRRCATQAEETPLKEAVATHLPPKQLDDDCFHTQPKMAQTLRGHESLRFRQAEERRRYSSVIVLRLFDLLARQRRRPQERRLSRTGKTSFDPQRRTLRHVSKKHWKCSNQNADGSNEDD